MREEFPIFGTGNCAATTACRATVNEEEGWVQNLNQANIQAHLTQYQQQVQAFIESHNPDATVGEILGVKAIQQLSSPVLAAGLPYMLTATGNRYAVLPDSLRHKFRYSLYANAYERSIGNPLWTYVEATPSLAAKKITLSFASFSDEDRQTVESYLPAPHSDGSPAGLDELPSSLPAYNIRVTAELRVEGSVVARGGALTIGTEMIGEGGFTRLHDLADWDLTQEQLVAGQATGVGLSLGGHSPETIEAVRSRMAELLERLEQGEAALTSEGAMGETFTATLWGYFGAVEAFRKSAAARHGVVSVPGLSYGIFYAAVHPSYRYGLVHRVDFVGLTMDISHLRNVAFDKSNSSASWRTFNRYMGKHASTMESTIPEVLFDDPTDSVQIESISTTKAIALALREGQKIYTLTQANQAQIASLQHSASVMSNVRSAVAAGKVVTIHERPLEHAGFVGAGYEIVDAATGAGSYLIEGGANGSRTTKDVLFGAAFAAFVIGSILLPLAFTLLGTPAAALFLPFIFVALGLILTSSGQMMSYTGYPHIDDATAFICELGLSLLMVGLALLLGPLALAVGAGLFSLIMLQVSPNRKVCPTPAT